MEKPFTVTVDYYGQTLIGRTTDARSAHQVAQHFAALSPSIDPPRWHYDGDEIADLLVRRPNGPIHVVLLLPDATVSTVLATCCGDTIELSQADVFDPLMPCSTRGIPCSLCHIAWARRYEQLEPSEAIPA